LPIVKRIVWQSKSRVAHCFESKYYVPTCHPNKICLNSARPHPSRLSLATISYSVKNASSTSSRPVILASWSFW
jgi:hypothetical protein